MSLLQCFITALCALLLIVIPLVGCSARVASVPQLRQKPQKFHAVVFVPGFKGSALSKEGSQPLVWVSLKHALFNLSSLALAVPDSKLSQSVSKFETSGILTHVPIFGGLYSYSIYDTALENLQSLSTDTIEVFPFAYDWREDLVSSAHALGSYIAELEGAGYKKITIVAHSMGGLVAAYYLRYGMQELSADLDDNWLGAEKVASVVFAGTPFYGAVTIFQDMQDGIRTFLNTSLLSAEALSTFPACYQLLPGSAEVSIVTEGGIPSTERLHDVSFWERYRWGLLKDAPKASKEFSARKTFVQQQLNRAALFTEKITRSAARPMPHTIRVLNLIGTGAKTRSKVVVNSIDAKTSGAEAVTLQFDDGDGIVPTTAAALPQAFTTTDSSVQFRAKADHGSVISSEESLHRIRAILDK